MNCTFTVDVKHELYVSYKLLIFISLNFVIFSFRSLIQTILPFSSSSFSSHMNHIVILLGHGFMMAQLVTHTMNSLWNVSAIFQFMHQVTLELTLA